MAASTAMGWPSAKAASAAVASATPAAAGPVPPRTEITAAAPAETLASGPVAVTSRSPKMSSRSIFICVPQCSRMALSMLPALPMMAPAAVAGTSIFSVQAASLFWKAILSSESVAVCLPSVVPLRMHTRSCGQWGACAAGSISICTPWVSRSAFRPEPPLPITAPAEAAGTRSLTGEPLSTAPRSVLARLATGSMGTPMLIAATGRLRPSSPPNVAAPPATTLS
mmetsp:Transcript_39919/g.103319  ORF Transcript_39919/g.103319 Transcript_39919/m.103319 type:complete len:225 (-) Transcript_39919:1087-1761(-)